MDKIERAKEFRNGLNLFIDKLPELFPCGIENGYLMKEIRTSKKTGIKTRRIIVEGSSFTVRPSFVMPYHAGFTDDVEKGLFLRKFDVPFWGLCHTFGRNAMFWYRIEQSIGRNSIVGTTVKNSDLLPEHPAADEKHSRRKGDKVYVPTTVGSQCISGVSVSENAGENSLKKACGKFRNEALNLNPQYQPKSVNTDGWQAAVNAWKSLFPGIFIIACFLHVFIKIRDRSSRKFRDLFNTAADKMRNCYEALSKASFPQRVRRLCEWADTDTIPDVISKPIIKLKKEPERLFESLRCTGMPQNHHHGGQADAENGSSFVFGFLFPRKSEGRRTEHQRPGIDSQLCSEQSGNGR